eukprot:COSAG04_NODE_2714_length_3695_cov_1.815628_2_plen_214_part_00
MRRASRAAPSATSARIAGASQTTVVACAVRMRWLCRYPRAMQCNHHIKFYSAPLSSGLAARDRCGLGGRKLIAWNDLRWQLWAGGAAESWRGGEQGSLHKCTHFPSGGLQMPARPDPDVHRVPHAVWRRLARVLRSAGRRNGPPQRPPPSQLVPKGLFARPQLQGSFFRRGGWRCGAQAKHSSHPPPSLAWLHGSPHVPLAAQSLSSFAPWLM